MIGLPPEQKTTGTEADTEPTPQRRFPRRARHDSHAQPARNPLKSRAALAGWLLALAILIAIVGGPEPSSATGSTTVPCLAASTHTHRVCTGRASAYGPGLYGNRTACRDARGHAITLRPGTIGVAHRSLPCGARVTICAAHRCAAVRVIDRGPYAAGRTFDLTEATTRRVWHMSANAWGVRTVTYRRGWNA